MLLRARLLTPIRFAPTLDRGTRLYDPGMTRTFATRRLAQAALLASVVLGIALMVPSAGAVAPTPVYPDLVSDPPEHAGMAPAVYDDGSGNRLLVRFDGFIHNQGQGALEMRGSGPVSREMSTVAQRIYYSDSSHSDQTVIGEIKYEENDDHHHWHFMRSAKYSLWNDAKTAEAAPASKVGFCLGDIDRVSGSTPYAYSSATTGNCQWGDDLASSVMMGVSAGWRDVYDYGLTFQWVDASNVLPGRYWLRNDVDPDGVVKESNEINPPGWASTRNVIPGYVAQPVDLGEIPNAAKAIDLPATTFGSPGPRNFRVVEGPAHGQLNKSLNQWFAGQVTYTPDGGYTGPDTFKFEAKDSTSGFPLNPAQATVTLSVGDPPPPGLAISGAPARMYAGTAVQLTASAIGGASPNVTWSTDQGTISSSGLYTAPGAPPAGGVAHVTATSESGPSDQVSIGIDPKPAPRPAPISKAAAPPTTGNPLAALRLLRHGRRLMVTTTASSAGTLAMAVRGRTKRRLAWCDLPVARLTPVTCRMRLARAFASTSRIRRHRLTVKAVLRVGRRVVGVRRARVPVLDSEHSH
jgi:lysyl oxidase/Big-like domain-containing protein